MFWALRSMMCRYAHIFLHDQAEGTSKPLLCEHSRLYIGAVIGAGFASGQEIWRFFGLYGSGGCWSV